MKKRKEIQFERRIKKECMLNYKEVLKQQRRVEGEKCSDGQVVEVGKRKEMEQSQERRIS